MQIIRCTQKLFSQMKVPKSAHYSGPEIEAEIGAWYAKLVYIDRRKCVLFTNERSLAHFFVADVARADIANLAGLFRNGLRAFLSCEGIPWETINRLLVNSEHIEYAPAQNKSVLGSMNDIAFHYKFHIGDDGGIDASSIEDVVHKLNRMPMGALKYSYPIEKLKEMLAVKSN